MDHTAHYFLAAPNPGRSWQKQVRAGGRKRPLATTTHHSQAPGKTASMHEDGSSAPRLLGKSGSDMETSALHRPARNLLRWHRELFRLYWKRRSKASSHKPKVAAETIALIREMAKENRLWGAERIRGELLKLGLRVCKRTIQKYMRTVRTPQPRGQTWATFLRTHAAQVWACDAPPGHRSLLSTALCVFPHRIAVTQGHPCGRDTLSHRCLGGPTTARSHPVWASAEVFES